MSLCCRRNCSVTTTRDTARPWRSSGARPRTWRCWTRAGVPVGHRGHSRHDRKRLHRSVSSSWESPASPPSRRCRAGEVGAVSIPAWADRGPPTRVVGETVSTVAGPSVTAQTPRGVSRERTLDHPAAVVPSSLSLSRSRSPRFRSTSRGRCLLRSDFLVLAAIDLERGLVPNRIVLPRPQSFCWRQAPRSNARPSSCSRPASCRW